LRDAWYSKVNTASDTLSMSSSSCSATLSSRDMTKYVWIQRMRQPSITHKPSPSNTDPHDWKALHSYMHIAHSYDTDTESKRTVCVKLIRSQLSLPHASMHTTEIPRDVLCHVKSWLGVGNSTNEYGEYKFLIELYTNFVSILYGLWDITAYLWHRNFSTPLSYLTPLWGDPYSTFGVIS